MGRAGFKERYGACAGWPKGVCRVRFESASDGKVTQGAGLRECVERGSSPRATRKQRKALGRAERCAKFPKGLGVRKKSQEESGWSLKVPNWPKIG